MKFTPSSLAIFLATTAMASPGGQSVVDVLNAGSAEAVSTFICQAVVVSAEIPSKNSIQEADEVKLTGTVGQVTTTKPINLTSTASTGSSTNTATERVSHTSSTIHGWHALPTAIVVAISGISGVLGFMIAM